MRDHDNDPFLSAENLRIVSFGASIKVHAEFDACADHDAIDSLIETLSELAERKALASIHALVALSDTIKAPVISDRYLSS